MSEDWNKLLEMSNEEFEAHLVQQERESKKRFHSSLKETFECKPLTKEDFQSAVEQIKAAPSWPPPPPIFIHPGDMRVMRKHFQETGCQDMFCYGGTHGK